MKIKKLSVLSLCTLLSASAWAGLDLDLDSLNIELQSSPDAIPVLGNLFDGSRRMFAAAAPVRQSQEELKRKMLQNLDFVESVFEAQYAPTLWKRQYSGWNLAEEISKAKEEVTASETVSISQYQDILRRFFHSTKDYHVSVGFESTETSSLPFSVIGADGRYFISWIDRSKLTEESFPFNVGDELVGFDGRATGEVVGEIEKTLGENATLTDKALASLYLTRRRASYLGKPVQGPVTIAVKPKGADKSFTHQLIWDYTPEMVQDRSQFGVMSVEAKRVKRPVPLAWLDNAGSPVADKGAQESGNPSSLGRRESFLPDLGVKIWESGEDEPFYAAIYKSPVDGKLMGSVRIPSYTPEDENKAVEHFAKLMKKFEGTTEGLVIDQLNNPGGSVFYLYSLVSMLTDQALSTPRHRIAITQSDVSEAARFMLDAPKVHNDEEAKKLLGETIGGYPVSYEVFRHFLEFSRFIVGEWNAGRTLTEPTFLWGVDKINPSTTARYTKPVMVLVNELDFSGGDFFPAILQDNKRATIFGTRTAGAGGFIRKVEYPNQLGVQNFVFTGSIAERIDKNPIENLGISPDIQRAMTGEDYQNHFSSYVKAVNENMAKILQAPSR